MQMQMYFLKRKDNALSSFVIETHINLYSSTQYISFYNTDNRYYSNTDIILHKSPYISVQVGIIGLINSTTKYLSDFPNRP